MNPVGNILSGLVDMETGSFTPELIDNISGQRENYTAKLAEGWYIRVGKLVHITINMVGVSGLPSKGNSARRAAIGGLPFGVAYGTSFSIATISDCFCEMVAAGDDITAVSFGGGRRIIAFLHTQGGNTAYFSSSRNNAIISVSGVYITNDVTPAGG